MYDNFYLSKSQVEIVEQFHKGSDTLVIYGSVGCGKTTLAREILKDSKLSTIDVSMIRDHSVISQIIGNLSKRNITQMFRDTIGIRALLVDDIHIFYKEDRKTYLQIIDLMTKGRTGNLRYTKIVITCIPEMINHRKFYATRSIRLPLNRTKSSYYHLVQSIVKDKGYSLNTDEFDELVHRSNFDLHKLIHLISEGEIVYDSHDMTDTSIHKIIMGKMTPQEIISSASGQETVISLNLLDSATQITPKPMWTKVIPWIYTHYVISDRMNTFINKYNYWEFQEYPLIMSIFPIQLLSTRRPTNVRFNRYISKSLIHIYSKRIHSVSLSECHSKRAYWIAYQVLHQCDIQDDWETQITQLGKKYIKQVIQSINHYYKSKNKPAEKLLISWAS